MVNFPANLPAGKLTGKFESVKRQWVTFQLPNFPAKHDSNREVKNMIYFIQNERTMNIKIGYTATDPEQRLRTLQTGADATLKLLFVNHGDLNRESELHEVFKEWKVCGEWFAPSYLILFHMITGAAAHAYAQGIENGKDK